MKESEIWYILNGLVRGTGKLHEMKMPHGDIQPKTVHLTKDGQLHLLNHHFMSAGQSGYYKMITTPGYKTPLSPDLLKQLKYKKVRPVHDQKASDLWAIGITILCACTNSDFDHYYDWDRSFIRYDKIKRDFDRMKSIGYKEDLVDLLSEILEETEPRRIKFEEVERFLDHVEEERSVKSALSRNSSLRGSAFIDQPPEGFVYDRDQQGRPSNPLMSGFGDAPAVIVHDIPTNESFNNTIVSPQPENIIIPVGHNQVPEVGFVTPPFGQLSNIAPPQPEYEYVQLPVEEQQHFQGHQGPPQYIDQQQYYQQQPQPQPQEPQYQQQPIYAPPVQQPPQQQPIYAPPVQQPPQYQQQQPIYNQPPIQIQQPPQQQPYLQPAPVYNQYPPQGQSPSYNGTPSKYPYNSNLLTPGGQNQPRPSMQARVSYTRRKEIIEREPPQVSTEKYITPDGRSMRRSVYTCVGRTIVEEEEF